MISLEEIKTLIESKQINESHIDQLLESLPKSTIERLSRNSRLLPGNSIRPNDTSPADKAESGLKKVGNNNPMKTARGRAAVKRQAEANKRNANDFAEAKKFVDQYMHVEPQKIHKIIRTVSDKDTLREYIIGLTSGNGITEDWLFAVEACL